MVRRLRRGQNWRLCFAPRRKIKADVCLAIEQPDVCYRHRAACCHSSRRRTASLNVVSRHRLSNLTAVCHCPPSLHAALIRRHRRRLTPTPTGPAMIRHGLRSGLKWSVVTRMLVSQAGAVRSSLSVATTRTSSHGMHAWQATRLVSSLITIESPVSYPGLSLEHRRQGN